MDKEREVPVRIIIKRKRGGHGGHHGGSWKVAFADFMTAMFAMFLVLWLVNQSSDVKSAIAGYFQDPLGRASEFGSSITPGDGSQSSAVRPLTQSQVVEMRSSRLEELAADLREELEEVPELAAVQKFIEVTVTDDGIRIELLEDRSGLFFQSGSKAPSKSGRIILSLLGRELGKMSQMVVIEGHTDSSPYRGSNKGDNWDLSADRANAARKILVGNGLADSQIAEIRGLADRQLRNPEDPGAAENRRISITMLFDPIVSEAVATNPDGLAVARIEQP